jgi:hypothetical protein
VGVHAGSSDEIVVILGSSDLGGEADLIGDVRRELWQRFSMSPHDVVLVRDEEIPRSAGKLERAELKRRYVADELAIVR